MTSRMPPPQSISIGGQFNNRTGNKNEPRNNRDSGGIREPVGAASSMMQRNQQRGNAAFLTANKEHLALQGTIQHTMQLRHRNLLHIQKALSEEGCLWMNMIKIDNQDIKQMIHSTVASSFVSQPKVRSSHVDSVHNSQLFGEQNNQANEFYMKQKIERYYHLGCSLSKVLGLNDCQNFIQHLRNLLEEYEVWVVIQAQQAQVSQQLQNQLLITPQQSESLFQRKMNRASEKFTDENRSKSQRHAFGSRDMDKSGRTNLDDSRVISQSFTMAQDSCLENPIIQRIIQQPIYNCGEIRKIDARKREVYQQMREYRSQVQTLLQHTDMQQRILDEHNEVLSPSASIVGHHGGAMQAKNHNSRSLSGSKILGASFSPSGGLNMSGGNVGSSNSIDRNLVVYTGQKMINNRGVLPKVIHELNFQNLNEYKLYVKDHALKEKYYSTHVNKMYVARFPNPKGVQIQGGSRYKSPSQLTSTRNTHTGGQGITAQTFYGQNIPFFRLLQIRSLPLQKLDYCDIVSHLIKILIMVLLKTDTLVMTKEMVRKYQEIDELIQQLIVREIAADIGKVAQKLMIREIGRINICVRNVNTQVTVKDNNKLA